MLHNQPAGCAALAATLPGNDQHHREPARRSAHPNPPRHKLAKWLDGQTLDGFSLPENGEELPQDHGLSRTLDSGLWTLEAILSESQFATQQAVA